jgi:hypothetical protein
MVCCTAEESIRGIPYTISIRQMHIQHLHLLHSASVSGLASSPPPHPRGKLFNGDMKKFYGTFVFFLILTSKFGGGGRGEEVFKPRTEFCPNGDTVYSL